MSIRTGGRPSSSLLVRFIDPHSGSLRPDPQVERVDGPQWDGTTTKDARVPYMDGALLIKCFFENGTYTWKLPPDEAHRGFQMQTHRRVTGAAIKSTTRQKEEGRPVALTSGPAPAGPATRCMLDETQAQAVFAEFEKVRKQLAYSGPGTPSVAVALGYGYTVEPVGQRGFDLRFKGPGCGTSGTRTLSIIDFKRVIGLAPANDKTRLKEANTGKPSGRMPAGCTAWDFKRQCWLREDGSDFGSLRIETKCAWCPATLGGINPLTGRPFAAHHFAIDHTNEEQPSWLTSRAQGTAFADLSSGAAQYLCLVHNFQKTCDAEDGAQGSCRRYVPLGKVSRSPHVCPTVSSALLTRTLQVTPSLSSMSHQKRRRESREEDHSASLPPHPALCTPSA